MLILDLGKCIFYLISTSFELMLIIPFFYVFSKYDGLTNLTLHSCTLAVKLEMAFQILKWTKAMGWTAWVSTLKVKLSTLLWLKVYHLIICDYILIRTYFYFVDVIYWNWNFIRSLLYLFTSKFIVVKYRDCIWQTFLFVQGYLIASKNFGTARFYSAKFFIYSLLFPLKNISSLNFYYLMTPFDTNICFITNMLESKFLNNLFYLFCITLLSI